jgi:hypothetical protein
MLITIVVLAAIIVATVVCLAAYVYMTTDEAMHAGPPSWSMRCQEPGRHRPVLTP